ncbi:MAG: hypothetical protein AAGA48_13760 [Myxococcota bacterium]
MRYIPPMTPSPHLFAWFCVLFAGCGPSIRVLTSSATEAPLWSTLKPNELVYVDVTQAIDPDDNPCADVAFGPFDVRRTGFDVRNRDPHQLVLVHSGDVERFPFNVVSCEYVPGEPTMSVLRVRGFYVVVEFSIPTALEHHLRPIEVDIGKATRIVRDSGGDG